MLNGVILCNVGIVVIFKNHQQKEYRKVRKKNLHFVNKIITSIQRVQNFICKNEESAKKTKGLTNSVCVRCFSFRLFIIQSHLAALFTIKKNWHMLGCKVSRSNAS